MFCFGFGLMLGGFFWHMNHMMNRKHKLTTSTYRSTVASSRMSLLEAPTAIV